MKLIFELECTLYDINSGKKLIDFRASQVDEPTTSTGYTGGYVATLSNMHRIVTDKIYDYTPNNHRVVIDGVRYAIVARQPFTMRPTGERFGRTNKMIVLTLE